MFSVISIGFVFAVPVQDVILTSERSSEGEDKQICQNPDDIACFFLVNDPRHIGVINTKIQTEPYETYYNLRCSRAHKFDTIYTLAENQLSDECLRAINFTDLC